MNAVSKLFVVAGGVDPGVYDCWIRRLGITSPGVSAPGYNQAPSYNNRLVRDDSPYLQNSVSAFPLLCR